MGSGAPRARRTRALEVGSLAAVEDDRLRYAHGEAAVHATVRREDRSAGRCALRWRWAFWSLHSVSRYGAGWRSHVQRIMIGLSTASLAQMGVQGIWEIIARHTTPHSRAEYEHVLGLRRKLLNTNSAVYLLVLIWWIVCLWIDEPGAGLRVPRTEGASAVNTSTRSQNRRVRKAEPVKPDEDAGQNSLSG